MRVDRCWLAAAGFFALVGAVAGLVVRAELARPGLQVVGKQGFATVSSVHGTVTYALVAVPLAVGLAWLVLRPPARFPATLAPGLFAAGGLLMLVTLLKPVPSAYGWFSYEPLPAVYTGSAPARWPLVAGLAFVTVAVVAAVVPLLAARRDPAVGGGRSTSPFATAVAAAGAGALLVAPVALARLVRLGLDAGIPSVAPERALQPVVGVVAAPAVLLVVLPFLGVIGEVTARAAGRPLAGRRAWTVATWAGAVLAVLSAYGTWLWPGSTAPGWLPVPAGFAVAVLVGCWLVTAVRGSGAGPPSPAVLFAGAGALALVLGGVSGLVLGLTDALLDDSTFASAHHQEAYLGPILFGGFAGLYRWWPRLTGRRLPDRTGRVQAGLTVLGFQLMVLPQFWLGFGGMPDRYADYLPADGFSPWQGLSGVGAVVLAASAVLFVVGVVRARPAS